MSVPIKNPTYNLGTCANSGDINTGEIMYTRGGGRSFCVWSGSILTNAALPGAPGAVQSGGHVLLYSGAGRLNSVMQHQNVLTLSGVPLVFYDAASITLSGTSVSGQRIIGTLNLAGGVSGQFTLAATPTPFDMPFNSGLCVSAASGTPGFTCTITPETNENGTF